ncbi:MFS general substrate transporter [Mycena olivaceomarginata]|nr:MFS general substrate transporter [Mycena olivaceomarginata]
MDSKNWPTHIVEEKASVDPAEDLFNPTVDTSGIDERRLMRRIDLRLLSTFILLYVLSFLDRSSIGKWLYNLEDDLKMSDKQYLLALTVFFFSYAIFEVPSNIFLKRLRPSVWFSVLMCMWGLMMTLQGFAHNFGGLLGLRWMLGMFEAGLFPGMFTMMSSWYQRRELGIRIAILHCATTVAGAFGGLLAAAISNLDGKGGKPAWSWIFIIEGLATIMAGISSIWIVQDFPDSAKFLTEAERTFVVRRLQGDDQFSASGENFRKQAIVASFRDWKTWLGSLMGCDMPLYAFALFTPSIINQVAMHTVQIFIRFRATVANLLVVPVYAFASIVTCCVAVYADKHGRRGYCAIGYIILIVSRNAALSYFAVFVATCGIFPVVRSAWISNNLEGSYKRGVSLAMAISIGNLNGAVSSNVYRAKDQPWYPLGLVLAYICIGIIANATFLYFLKKKENARRDRGERDEIIGQMSESEDNGNGKFATVEDAKRQKGDQWSGYRYIL